MVPLSPGGGSALLPAPIPPILLQEKLDVTRKLAAAGATIQELNTVRRALSFLKGGGLAHYAHPAQVTYFFLLTSVYCWEEPIPGLWFLCHHSDPSTGGCTDTVWCYWRSSGLDSKWSHSPEWSLAWGSFVSPWTVQAVELYTSISKGCPWKTKLPADG